MSISAGILPEFKHEMTGLRRIVALSPAEKQYDWKPHPKSMALGPLTAHLVGLAGWSRVVTQSPGLDLAGKDDRKDFGGSPFSSHAALKQFDENVAQAIAALETTGDDTWKEPWTLRSGDHVVFTMPRIAVMRNAVLNHIIHHRAQLGVYLRLLGIPVPGLYGPSADER
jgi:uncharacterized damage-inducible protein DinB